MPSETEWTPVSPSDAKCTWVNLSDAKCNQVNQSAPEWPQVHTSETVEAKWTQVHQNAQAHHTHMSTKTHLKSKAHLHTSAHHSVPKQTRVHMNQNMRHSNTLAQATQVHMHHGTLNNVQSDPS
jgi:hypothetical protein